MRSGILLREGLFGMQVLLEIKFIFVSGFCINRQFFESGGSSR